LFRLFATHRDWTEHFLADPTVLGVADTHGIALIHPWREGRRARQMGRTTTGLARQRVLRPLLRCDVLVVDELGYLPTEPSFGPALYEIIAGRYERRPTIITSNKSLTEWGSLVQDVSLAAALVDRLLHHGQVFYLKGPSWRTRGRSQQESQPPAATG
jgi:hypothetical protein